jgi:hypothetical protein
VYGRAVNCTSSRTRRPIRPPEGYEGYISRREAAARLGLASEFKIRQFEREGRLHAVRGQMGTAFYPETEVLNLRASLTRSAGPNSHGRWSDADLITFLQQPRADGRARSAVDLVTEAHVSIARAERVYRFWSNQNERRNSTEPTLTAEPARTASPRVEQPTPETAAAPTKVESAKAAPAPTATTAVERRKSPSAGPRERRSPARLTREALLHQMRHPDPRVRDAAFAKLKDSATP